MFRWAMKEGRVVDNPTLGVECEQIKTSGYKAWDEIEIASYEAAYGIGSKAQLAMALMLYTGARKSDARLLGPANIIGDRVRFKQQKTRTVVDVPLHPKLRAIIEATPTVGIKHFVVTKSGKPYSIAALATACAIGAMPPAARKCHRMAWARRAAHGSPKPGATTHEIAAVLGHASLSEVERYTKAAERKRLPGQGIAKPIEGGW